MLKILLNSLKTGYTLLLMTSQWRFDNQQFILFINFH